MTGTIPHIVLTRFNLALNFACKKREDSTVPQDKPWLEPDYLEKRFDIFEKYTYPSFAGQTDKNFKWIVMFHKDTPQKFKERIQKLSQGMEQMEAWFLDDEECRRCTTVIREYILQTYQNQGVITSRVDNDDIVHETFIESIKADMSQFTEDTILSYENGLQYDTRNREIMKYDYANNHFLSLFVADTKGNNHILSYDHSAIDCLAKKEGLKRCVKNTQVPLWVEVLTMTNYSNAPRWRFSALTVPYNITQEYPVLDVDWNSRMQWIAGIIIGVGKVFFHRGLGLVRMVLKK